MKTSNYLALNWLDAGKGLIVAVLSAVLTALANTVADGTLPTADDWKKIAVVAIASGSGYLLKNFLSNSNGAPLKKEGNEPA